MLLKLIFNRWRVVGYQGGGRGKGRRGGEGGGRKSRGGGVVLVGMRSEERKRGREGRGE